MKTTKIILGLLLLLTTYSNSLTAQTLKEKMKAQKEKLQTKIDEANAKAAEKHGPLDPTISQSIMAAKFEEKTYSVYKITSGGGCYEDGELTLSLGKDDTGLITSIKLDDVPYDRDEEGKSDFIRYYSSKKGTQNVVFLKNKILLFQFSDKDLTNITGLYYLGESGTYSDVEKAQNYMRDARESQTADLDAFAAAEKAAAEKAAAERKAKYGLEGKNVKSIEVTDVSTPHTFSFYRTIEFNITSTLADGKKISTKGGAGFWEDYEITYKNASIEGYSKQIMPKQFIDGDAIIIEVKNKHNPLIRTTKKITMQYNEDIAMKYHASVWGTSAHNFKIEVKQVKHAIDGSDILMIRFKDLNGEYGTQIFKMKADKTLHVFADGQPGNQTIKDGYTFAETGPGQNAGNGGNITVIKDPSVKEFNIVYSNYGGTGGAGTYGYNAGRNGRDGIYKEEVKAVNF